ncbi:MAG TPA: Trm112 family protein [Nitrososphaerales archaeon]|nr:Trm112 family protein [Nitrososphaerales archaeon]
MKRKLLDILACPIDKHFPIELFELKSEGDLIVDGVLVCTQCNRFYPIIDEIPVMLPDDLRNKTEDMEFLTKYKDKLPEKVAKQGKPYHLE